MSDGKEVKRWEPCLKDSPAGTFVTMRETRRVRDVFVSVTEHEAIVAELMAAISQLKENEAKLKAEIERLKHFYQVPIRYPIGKGKGLG